MKVMFLTPPALDGKPDAERIFGCNYGIYPSPNIFILTLAAILKREGVEISLRDFPVEGLGPREFRAFAQQDDSDIYVFYTVFLSKETDLSAREIIREHCPGARIIYLGTEPTANPDQFIALDSVVIRGEPDETIRDLVPKLYAGAELSGVLGISYLTAAGPCHNPERPLIQDLDTLPFPDRSLVDSRKHYNPKLSRLPYTVVMTSRGCAYRCYYCVPNSLDFAREIEYKQHDADGRKPPVRVRSARNVLEEIRQIKEEGYRSFFILDDQFLWDEERTTELLHGLKQLDMEWACLARADRLQNEEIVRLLAEAGCRFVAIGVESFKQEILDYIRKDLKIEMVYTAVANLRKYRIEPELNILLASCPLETKESIRYTVEEAIKLDVDYTLISACTPFPHTEFNKIASEQGWMIAPEYAAIDPIKQSFIAYPHLSREEIESELRRAYMRFYFRPAYILKRLKKIEGIRDLWNKAKAAMSILR